MFEEPYNDENGKYKISLKYNLGYDLYDNIVSGKVNTITNNLDKVIPIFKSMSTSTPKYNIFYSEKNTLEDGSEGEPIWYMVSFEGDRFDTMTKTELGENNGLYASGVYDIVPLSMDDSLINVDYILAKTDKNSDRYNIVSSDNIIPLPEYIRSPAFFYYDSYSYIADYDSDNLKWTLYKTRDFVNYEKLFEYSEDLYPDYNVDGILTWGNKLFISANISYYNNQHLIYFYDGKELNRITGEYLGLGDTYNFITFFYKSFSTIYFGDYRLLISYDGHKFNVQEFSNDIMVYNEILFHSPNFLTVKDNNRDLITCFNTDYGINNSFPIGIPNIATERDICANIKHFSENNVLIESSGKLYLSYDDTNFVELLPPSEYGYDWYIDDYYILDDYNYYIYIKKISENRRCLLKNGDDKYSFDLVKELDFSRLIGADLDPIFGLTVLGAVGGKNVLVVKGKIRKYIILEDIKTHEYTYFSDVPTESNVNVLLHKNSLVIFDRYNSILKESVNLEPFKIIGDDIIFRYNVDYFFKIDNAYIFMTAVYDTEYTTLVIKGKSRISKNFQLGNILFKDNLIFSIKDKTLTCLEVKDDSYNNTKLHIKKTENLDPNNEYRFDKIFNNNNNGYHIVCSTRTGEKYNKYVPLKTNVFDYCVNVNVNNKLLPVDNNILQEYKRDEILNLPDNKMFIRTNDSGNPVVSIKYKGECKDIGTIN